MSINILFYRKAFYNVSMENCIFCKIIDGKIKSETLYEDQDTIVLLDVKPSAPGHSMVIPKKHGASILDYSQEELGNLMAIAQKAARKIESELKSDAITMGINHKEKEGVHHLHFHLIPRWNNDGGNALQSVVTNKSAEDLKSIAEKIKFN